MSTLTNTTAYIEELEAMDKIWITPKQAAPGYGVSPYWFNVVVDEDMRRYGEIIRLPFKVIRTGRQVKIHRISYIRWLRESGMAGVPPWERNTENRNNMKGA